MGVQAWGILIYGNPHIYIYMYMGFIDGYSLFKRSIYTDV
jgi:hypothetical protein